MRYLSIVRAPETSTPPSPEEMAAMGALIEKFSKSGHLLATDGCLPSRLGFRVRKAAGKVTVTDGPFTETKEIIGGFALLRADSKDQMIELLKEFLEVHGDGECEVRQLWEEPALAS
jgi:hypothetical protein